MRIMAIDYGDAHTGVALSDPTGLLAGTATTIHSRKAEVVLEELAFMAFHTQALTPGKEPMQQELLDKHYLRKHGKNAYYGQK